MTDNLQKILEMATGEGYMPPELAEEIASRREVREQRLTLIATVLRDKRKAAVEARASSGIEEEWREAEDQYDGIDDANRTESRELKSASLDGPITSRVPGVPDVRSTVFLNLTRPYTDAAAARISDMLQPTDDRAWAIRPTPVPEVEDRKKDTRPAPGVPPMQVTDPAGQPATDPQTGQPIARPTTFADIARAKIDAAAAQATAAEKRIDDWLTQARYPGEFRAFLLDCAKMGSGVMKGPVPVWRKGRKATKTKTGVSLTLVSTIEPESHTIPCWNLYPDPACGNDFHKGAYCFECDNVSSKTLRDLRGLPGYSTARINKVLKEGPKSKFEEARIHDKEDMEFSKDEFEIWYFYGELERQDFDTLNADEDDLASLFDEGFGDLDSLQQGTSDKGAERVFAMVTMVNDTPIQAVINPLDSGEFPYDILPWQERADSPWGYGVPYQIRDTQRIANAACRNMMDNAGLSGGPILVIDKTMVEPEDGDWTLRPRKVFRMLEGAIGKDVRTAFQAVNIPSLQNDLMAIIQFAMKTAEDVTGLPMILQGQLGKAPDTVGGMQMLNNNATSVTRRLARLADDRHTEPHIGRYYEWLMLYGPEDYEKGDFLIDARASSSLVERDIQNQLIQGLVQMSMNPVFQLSPSRTMEEFLRSQHLDPKRFQLTDDEKQKAAQAAQQQQPPQVMVAQIREQGALQRAQIEAQTTMQRVQADTDRDTAYQQALTDKVQVDAQLKQRELELKYQLAMLDYANKNNTTLAEIKAELAQSAAKINLQRELATTPPAGAPQIVTPPAEPAGRAPEGEAFQA